MIPQQIALGINSVLYTLCCVAAGLVTAFALGATAGIALLF